MTEISIARQFAKYPFGRYREHGPYSGQRFREEFLEPALRNDNEVIRVVLDGAVGMGSSFLDESFGGLIRSGFDRADVQRRIVPISKSDGSLVVEIQGYIADAKTPQQRAYA